MTAACGRAVAQPLTLRGTCLRNRVVAAPMERNYCDLAGRPTQQYVDYLAARAAGGAALVFTESSYVAQASKARPHQMGMHDDTVLPGLRAMADAVHDGGALLGVELNHAGRVVPSAVSQQVPVGPSAVACEEIGGEVPHALTEDEVQVVVRQFAEAADRAVRGGADVLSVHGAHGYLVGQFLSPRSNRREDRYRRPTAFLDEVLRAVREAAGDEVPLFVRLSAFEGLPGGRDVEDSLALVDDMALDVVDVVDLSAGTYGAGHWITPSGEVAEGYLGDVARRYRERTGLPVSVAGRVVSPEAAERLVGTGAADLVSAARAFHADPAWGGHVVQGTQPRPCISCNQGCADVIFTGMPLWCAANPATGREGLLRRAPRARADGVEVVVVGAGPAGLQAAVDLATAGARVTLRERSTRVGGQHRLASALVAKPQFGRLLTWFEDELDRLGVDVVLGQEGTDAATGDAVVVATGSEDYLPAVPGVGLPHVTGVRRWLARHHPDDLPDAVTLWGDDRVALYVADDLTARGTHVTLLSRGSVLAPEAGARERLHAVERVGASPLVDLVPGVVVHEVRAGTVVVGAPGHDPYERAAPGPLLVSQGAVPRTHHLLAVADTSGPLVEHATGADLLTTDAALRHGRDAAARVLQHITAGRARSRAAGAPA